MTNLLIGIDGFDKQLVEKFNLSFQREGAFGDYKPIYCSTVPSWTSIYTGLTREEHGAPPGWRDWLFNQVKTTITKSSTHKPGEPGGPINYSFNYRKLPFVWDRINKEGISTGVYGMPLTYPVRKINGWMVAGFPAPNVDQHRLFYPVELSSIVKQFSTDILQVLDTEFITHFKQMGPRLHKEFAKYDTIEFIDKFSKLKKANVLRIINQHPCEVYFIGLNFLDHAGHLGIINETDMGDVYRILDEFIMDLLSSLNPEKMIIVSDHGGQIFEVPSPEDKRYLTFQHTNTGVFFTKNVEIDEGELHECDITRHILRLVF